MAILRFKALEVVSKRQALVSEQNAGTLSELFAENVFSKEIMKRYLATEAFEKVMDAINQGTQIDRKIADQVATSMKLWAMSKGATHYTHWFQPLTGMNAEKHDAFIDRFDGGETIEKFSGSELAQQEPDASSFPSGGLRNTFEARGYTAWDPTSPAFIMGRVLCVPTIFVSYTGEALDYKTPLLKSIQAIDKAAVEVCEYFDKNVTKVAPHLGWEQEYYLVDSALFNARPDMVLTGRTLFGHTSSRGHQLGDHYFGSIPERALAFMQELEVEAVKVGIPVKTRHNEVAPNQYEFAPVHEEANLSVDHNQLVMDLMDKLAKKHGFNVLLHEKPFAELNGSGKHNNWSLYSDTGMNLLSPGTTPKTNLRFLTFFICAIKAAHDFADLLRSTSANAGNDLRLGVDEAPPNIMSVFIGSQLTAVLDDLLKRVKGGKMTPDEKTELKLNIGKIPQILVDNTDRNRTSPFAFTGNKFEFRAVGSSANCASIVTVLNTIVANQLLEFKRSTEALIVKGRKRDEAIFETLRNYIVASKNILFEGNSYSQEWIKEAEKRKLSNFRTTPDAVEALKSQDVVKLFESMGVMSEREIEARYDLKVEQYKLKIQIESRVMGDLVLNHVIPTAIRYQNMLLENVKGIQELLIGGNYRQTAATQIDMIKEISERVTRLRKGVDHMVKARKSVNKMASMAEQAQAYCQQVRPFFDQLRYEVDKLELLIDDEDWPLPKYRELLFTK